MSQLSADRKKLLEKMLAERGVAKAASLPEIVPCPGPAPLSFGQERLWLIDQLAPNSTAYHLPAALRLRGPLDVEALRGALDALCERHQVLRTVLFVEDGQPKQRLGEHQGMPFSIRDVPAAALEEEISTAAARPFDLARGPLARAELFRLGSEEHVLVLTVHHIVSDAWSTALAVRELAELYRATVKGEKAQLAALPCQYADYATWQRKHAEGAAFKAQLESWRRALQGPLPRLELPSDGRAAGPVGPGAQVISVLPARMVAAANALAAKEQASLFMVLLSAFKALLCRLTGSEDLIVGTPIAGRTRAQVEPLIGFFLNTLPLRTRIDVRGSFLTCLRAVREVSLQAFAKQDVPFELLGQPGAPVPLEVLFNLINTPDAELTLDGLSIAPIEPSQFEAKVPLTLYVEPRGAELQLKLAYRSDRYGAERMKLLLEQYARLLEAALDMPEAPLEQHSLRVGSVSARLPDPRAPLPAPEVGTVWDRFTLFANGLPERPALSWGDRRLSYGELYASAREIRGELIAAGVQPGEVVAVTGTRSFGLVASILGVVAARGVLLLLDPALPEKRRQTMLELAKATARVVVDEGGLARVYGAPPLTSSAAPQARSREAAWSTWPPDAASDVSAPRLRAYGPTLGVNGGGLRAYGPTLGVNGGGLGLPSSTGPLPSDPAYVFFTSGTTGTPKAVLGVHRGLSHFVAWQRDEFRIGEGDRVPLLTALSFDVVLRDLFLPLTSGATLCIPDRGMDTGPAATLRWLAREQVTALHVVPSVAQAWLAAIDPESDDAARQSVRWTFFAGEPLTDSLVERWRARFPRAGAVNLYGPTETTLAKCFFRVPAQPVPGQQPVGNPLPDTQALVLSATGRLCGPGELGEVVLRTPFRSLGYLLGEGDKPRFVPNPFTDSKDDLVYFTGDRGRYRPDGALELVGRADDQVKIRGVRVEPRELEAVLARLPDVAQAVVAARPDTRGELRLLAWVVARPGAQIDPATLTQTLRTELPPALVPSALAVLDALPLSANGKVDRSRLADPAAPRLVRTPPATELERTIAAVWRELLNLEELGTDESFFTVGGHSLLLLQLQTRLRQALGREIPIVDLFAHPTVAQLAAHLEGASPEAQAAATERIHSRADARRAWAARGADRRRRAEGDTHGEP